MELINRYFGKIIFVKADLREDHTIYVAALSSSFQDGKKQYALAFVPVHLAIITQGYLSDLQWVNLQTRTMTNGYRLQPQRWEIPKGLDTPLFTAVERTESKTRYLSDDHPLEMILIHDPKKKSKMQYHTHMNLLAALTTFKCVISLRDLPRLTEPPPESASQNFTRMEMTMRPGPSPYQSWTQNTGAVRGASESDRYTPITPQPSDDDYGAGYVSGQRSYTPGADGRYATPGLSDYTVPQVSQAPQKKGEVRREMISKPPSYLPQQSHPPPRETSQSVGVVDDSFEFI